MKYKLLFSLLAIIPLSTTCSQSVKDKVYICRSGTSYAYHKQMCKGLKKCTHKIEAVSIETARKTGHKKPCGYCYKGDKVSARADTKVTLHPQTLFE